VDTRSAQSRRSIFQVQEGEDSTIKAVTEEATESTPWKAQPMLHSDREQRLGDKDSWDSRNLLAGNSNTAPYAGLNFAVSAPVSEGVELIFTGQTGVGSEAPERFEASTRFRVGHRHKVGVTGAGLRVGSPVWISRLDNQQGVMGQVSMRAVDEWIVRDGIVIVMGVDYSKFVGGGGAHAITPRFGVQFDANARTRVKRHSLLVATKMAFRVSPHLKTTRSFSASSRFGQ
jgi:hypothetical protein